MRAFIAFELPKEVKDYLFDLANDFNDVLSAKWVAKKNLHLTLRFFKQINEKKLEEVVERLKNLEFKPIKVKLDKLGVFPRIGKMRVLWVDFKPVGPVVEVKDDIDVLIKDLFSGEKDFSIHLTLGRIKKIKDKEEFMNRLKTLKIKPMGFELDTIKILESKLTKDGPVYKLINRFDAR